jgi:O-antigen/teichoic acid export membrane protein
VAIYIMAAGDRVVIERQDGLAAVGRFQVAYAMGSLILHLLAAVNNAWSPIVFAAPESERWEVLADTAAALYRVASLIIGAIAMAAPVALLIVAPKAYDPVDLSPVTVLVAAAGFPYVGYLASVQVVFWVRHTGALALATPVAAVVNIVLVVLLLPVWGLTGAALATLAAYACHAAIIRALARRRASVPWRHRRELEGLLTVSLAVVLALALPVSGAWLVLRMAVAVALLAAGANVVRGAFQE